MATRFVISTIFIVLLSFAVSRDSLLACELNPISKVKLYTLKPNEVISSDRYGYGENHLAIYPNGHKYLLLTQRTISKDSIQHWVICNGVEHGPYPYYAYAPNDRSISEIGECLFEYRKKDIGMLFFGGGKSSSVPTSIAGDPIKWYSNSIVLGSGVFGTEVETMNGSRYVLIGDKVYGPFKNVYPFLTNSKGAFAFGFTRSGQLFVNFNGTELGPYEDVDDLEISQNGLYSFSFRRNNNRFVRIGEMTLGPFSSIGWTIVLDKANYAFTYKLPDSDLEYLRVGNRTLGPMEDIEAFAIALDGTLGFISKHDVEYYVQINDFSFGPYSDARRLQVVDGGHYLFRYKDSEGMDSWSADGFSVRDSFAYSSNASLWPNGNFAIENWCTLVHNRAIHKLPFCEVIYDDTGTHFLNYSKENLFDIAIDGQVFYNEGGFLPCYSPTLKSFYWLSLEGLDIYLKSYKVG